MRPRFSQRDIDFIQFAGGLDTDTPPLSLGTGFLRDGQNIEMAINGGYKTLTGYERYDGRPSPSDAAYAILEVTITGAYAVGDTVTGATSGATGVIAAVADDETYFVLTKLSGTFEAESLEISATPIATAAGAQTVDGASTVALHATYRNAAADIYRADIAAVPGSGAIRGVIQYNDVKYAFRDNAGATACALYKSTSGGWSLVSLGRELAFTSGGTTEIVEGDTITGATSGATAVLTRVVLESGSWAAGDAAGRFIFASQTGTFQAENINVGASPNLATIAGNSSAITLLPGGRYEFDVDNFTGLATTRRIYGADGVNRGLEFDGTVCVPIRTGMASHAPKFVRVHKNQLFFSFDSSVQHSGIGTPYKFTLLSGAAELAQGDTVTGMVVLAGDATTGAMAIFTRNGTKVLYGSSSANWNLVDYEKGQGAWAYTTQRMGLTFMLDDRGLTTLETSTKFGNFRDAVVSDRVQSWLKQRRTRAIASCLARDVGQYRLFFSDGAALYVTKSAKGVVGMTPVLFPDAVTCVWSGEKNDGSEEIFFGSDDGFVYQMERGTSFDGDSLEWWMNLAFNPSKNPRMNKQYKHATFEVSGDGYAEFDFTYELGYASSEIAQKAAASTVTVDLAAVLWDTFTWDAFVWDGRTLLPAESDVHGLAENVSLILRGNSDSFQPLTFSGSLLQYINRRIKR